MAECGGLDPLAVTPKPLSRRFPATLGSHSIELRARGGDRTHDILIKSQTLYQLSYSRLVLAVRMGLEPMTSTLTMWRSNQLN